jgi:Zn-dependent peptidase ImmA (M78 family)
MYIFRLEPLADDLYGQVLVDHKPFIVTINANMTMPRIQISFIHELLHVYCEMYKVSLSHEQLHVLSVLLTNDILPGVRALERFTK